MELWDLYDRSGNPLGRTAVRGGSLPEGCYHLVSEVLLRHADGDYLVMKRDPNKPIHPGAEEATAGGSALTGEMPLACAERELLEETGLTAGDYAQVGYRISDEGHSLFYSYLAVTDCPKDAVRLQAGETVGYRWLTEREFIAFVNSGEMLPGQRRRLEGYFKALGYLMDAEDDGGKSDEER